MLRYNAVCALARTVHDTVRQRGVHAERVGL